MGWSGGNRRELRTGARGCQGAWTRGPNHRRRLTDGCSGKPFVDTPCGNLLGSIGGYGEGLYIIHDRSEAVIGYRIQRRGHVEDAGRTKATAAGDLPDARTFRPCRRHRSDSESPSRAGLSRGWRISIFLSWRPAPGRCTCRSRWGHCRSAHLPSVRADPRPRLAGSVIRSTERLPDLLRGAIRCSPAPSAIQSGRLISDSFCNRFASACGPGSGHGAFRTWTGHDGEGRTAAQPFPRNRGTEKVRSVASADGCEFFAWRIATVWLAGLLRIRQCVERGTARGASAL